MKVTQAELVISAVGPKQYPTDALPEIALAGRSNVGKSSFINKMINRKSLARTSSKPGKTQTLNFYKINGGFFFVDVPGYGFAKVSKTERERWGQFIEEYISTREQLRAVIQLIDIRHAPTQDDQAMFEWLVYHEIPCVIVATKADKIPKGKVQKHVKVIKDTLGAKGVPILPFSAETAQGKDEVWSRLMEFVRSKPRMKEEEVEKEV